VSLRPKIVIDTSTLIGAILRPQSVPRLAFLNAVNTCDVCVSPVTLDELREVLYRSKFDRYISLQKRLEFLRLVSERSHVWQVDLSSETAANNTCRDTKDAKFLALALSCQALALISSDADLLVLNPWRGIPILTPASFLQEKRP
jgi:putative PIN family toxin of toxin-antitoxin system